MDAMTCDETGTYIAHHVKLAGRADTPSRTMAVELIHNTSRGLPAFNNLAAQAMLGAYGDRKAVVDLASARIAVNEVASD